jgi:outer membrane protein
MLRFPHRIGLVFVTAAASAMTPLAASAQSGPLPLLSQIGLQGTAATSPEAVRRLSIDEAVALALEQNLGIRIQRLDPQIQDVGVAQTRSFWAPSVVTNFTHNSQVQRATSALSGGATSVDNGTVATGIGMDQLLPWGGNYSTNWSSSRYTTTNLFSSYSPQLQSAVSFNYTQPLLRNLKIDKVRQLVQASGKSRDLSNIQLEGVIVLTMRNVKNAYWDLTSAINNLAAQRQSLELAQRSFRDNQRRVEVGTMAPIDIIQAQAEVALNEQNVIVAEAAIKQAQDRLRVLIFDPDMRDFWSTEIDPTDVAPFEEQRIDVAEAVRVALDKRADVSQAKNSVEQSDINIRYFRNDLLPDVNASVNYVSTGVGGIQLSQVDPFSIATGGTVPVRNVIADRGFGSVLGDVLQSAYPNWTVGVSVSYPLGMSTAQANMARARLQYQQAQTQVKNLQLQVALQVRDVARQVETNQQRVRSARASRELQEKKLEAEEKKQAAGMSSTFLVIQAQRDLALARTVEIQAIADYNKSLVDFEAVQAVPLNGLPGTVSGQPLVTVAGTGAIQSGGSAIIRQ